EQQLPHPPLQHRQNQPLVPSAKLPGLGCVNVGSRLAVPLPDVLETPLLSEVEVVRNDGRARRIGDLQPIVWLRVSDRRVLSKPRTSLPQVRTVFQRDQDQLVKYGRRARGVLIPDSGRSQAGVREVSDLSRQRTKDALLLDPFHARAEADQQLPPNRNPRLVVASRRHQIVL